MYICNMETHHINFLLMLQDASTEQEGKEKLVFLKQGATDIGVQAEGEILIDVDNPLLHIVCKHKTYTMVFS